MTDTKIGIFGAKGRMGRRVTQCINDFDNVTLQCALDRGDRADFEGCDVVIDFSTEAATDELCDLLKKGCLPLVTGVTGRSQGQWRSIEALSETRALFIASNFSVGIAVLNDLVRRGIQALGDQYSAEVMEVHHRFKVDAPSGTALTLGRTISEAKGIPWPESAVTRSGVSSARKEGEIGMSSLRGGDVVGDHTVFLLGPSERLELTHRASDRDVFALGAIRAARWLTSQGPGIYGMNDLVKPAFSATTAD